MKFKAITFIYQDKLTEDQENILIVNFQEIKKKAVEAIRKSVKDLDKGMMKVALGQNHGLVKARFETLADIIEGKLELTHPAENRYRFAYPEEDMTGYSFKFMGRQVSFSKVFPQRKIVKFIKNEVSKDMGIDGRTIMYEVEEFEEQL